VSVVDSVIAYISELITFSYTSACVVSGSHSC